MRIFSNSVHKGTTECLKWGMNSVMGQTLAFINKFGLISLTKLSIDYRHLLQGMNDIRLQTVFNSIELYTNIIENSCQFMFLQVTVFSLVIHYLQSILFLSILPWTFSCDSNKLATF